MKFTEAPMIPQWLKDSMETRCPSCGSEYEIGLSPNGQRVTKHYCPNMKCPLTLGARAAYMWDLLKVPGIKEAKSIRIVRDNNIQSHLELIPYVVDQASIPIRITAGDYMRIMCVPGIDSACDNYMMRFDNIESAIRATETEFGYDREMVEDAIRCLKYFNVVMPTRKQGYLKTYHIMITGDVNGFTNRDEFPGAVEYYFKGVFNIVYYRSKRKTGVDFLIKEPGSATTGKVQVANAVGIPILSSAEFIIMLRDEYEKLKGEPFTDDD